MERRGASIEDRTGESRLFQMILIVVLLEYYCGENISFNCFTGLYIRNVLITESVYNNGNLHLPLPEMSD